MQRVARFQNTPTLDTGAYAAGDQMSTLQTVDMADPLYGCHLASVTVLDGASQSLPLDIFFFDRSVTVAADQAASSFSDADMVFCLGVVNILAADYDANAANSIATVAITPQMPLISNGRGRRIYVAYVTRGAPTYAAGSLVFSFNTLVEDGG